MRETSPSFYIITPQKIVRYACPDSTEEPMEWASSLKK